MNKVLTIGTFDLLHVGHVNVFKKCREIAGSDGKVFVGVNSDQFIQDYKGRPPIITGQDRKIMVETNQYVDITFWYTGPQYNKDMLSWVEPNYVVIGTDWARKDYFKQLGISLEEFEERNISLVYTPYTKHISSTIIKERVCSQVK